MEGRYYFSSTLYVTGSTLVFYLYFLSGLIDVGETGSDSSAGFGMKTHVYSGIDGEISSDLEVLLAKNHNGTSIVHVRIDA